MKKRVKIFSAIVAVFAVAFGFLSTVSNARAVDPQGSSSSRVTVEVVVVGEVPGVTITRPNDGAEIVGLEFPVNTVYTDSSKLTYTLTYVDEDGTKTNYTLPEVVLSTTGVTSGTHSFILNAADYGGEYGDYILTVKADGAGSTTDSVSFKLIAFDLIHKGFDEKNKDPIVSIISSKDVYKTLLQVIDSEGRIVFDEPMEVILDADGETDVTLPFKENGVPNGVYTVIATGYDVYDTIIGPSRSVTFLYEVIETPDVPNTGSIFGIINLSRSDLISTGIALLIVSAIFGILVVAKRSRDQNKKQR